MSKYLFSLILLVMIISSSFLKVVQASETYVGGVIVAVSDIKIASMAYEKMGFTIKPGKLHDNGLLNAHIKLPNKTNIELMSLVGAPSDDISEKYSKILEQGESGAYLELTGSDADAFSKKIDGIDHEVIRGKYWEYVIFPEGSGLEHIFLFHPYKDYKSKSHFYIHKNNAKMINRVWIEGGKKVEELFQTLGFQHCGERKHASGLSGMSYKTSLGEIIVTKDETADRPKVLGVSAKMDAAPKDFFSRSEANGIWIDDGTQSVNCG